MEFLGNVFSDFICEKLLSHELAGDRKSYGYPGPDLIDARP